MNAVTEHYDALIDENNDPFRDPKPLKTYMEKWDGQKFIDCMQLDKRKTVLEIGVGTGRLANRVASLCKLLYGIDLSHKTIGRASENLSAHNNIKLVCDDFMSVEFDDRFDVIYSSLTFMHIEDKFRAIQKVASLLKYGGLFVLSIDKNQSSYIDMGIRKVKIFPDNLEDICFFLSETNLELVGEFETENAYVTVSKKGSHA